MNAWKVILAAAVIFGSGVVTGFQVASLRSEPPPPQNRGPQSRPGPVPRGDYLERLQRELTLTPVQRTKIEQIWRDSGERTKQIWESAREEHRKLRASIREQLTADQQKKFDEEFKPRESRKPPDNRQRDLRRSKESSEKGEAAKSVPTGNSAKP